MCIHAGTHTEFELSKAANNREIIKGLENKYEEMVGP